MLGAVVVAVSGLSSCTGSGPDRPAAPAPPPVVRVELREYRFEAPGAEVAAGRVVFQLRNRGDQSHQPTLLVLPDDVPPILEQLKGPTRRDVDPLATSAGLRTGVNAAVAVDLEAGRRYAFVCFAKTVDGRDHSRLGMAWEFRVAGVAKATAPTTTRS